MSEELDFSLPEPSEPRARRRDPLPLVLLLLLLAAVGTLLALAVYDRFMADAGPESPAGALTAEAHKELALRFEKQGLNESAVKAWKDYLDAGPHAADPSARIWYRIGTLLETEGKYLDAVEAYYRSESLATLSDLSAELSRRIQECLEATGSFSALRQELAERTTLGTDGAGEGEGVVAELGPQKVTRAALQSRIERSIEQQLAQYASFLPESDRLAQKEKMLRQFDSPQRQREFLARLLFEEALYRKAREEGLADDAEVRELLRDQERSLLARSFLEQEVAGRVQITPGDLQTYYEAHKQDYMQPEGAAVRHILVSDAALASNLVARAREGEDFAALAQEFSKDARTRENGGRIPGWIERKGLVPGVGYSPEFDKTVFETEPGQVAAAPAKSEQGYHVIEVLERRPETERSFGDAQADVYRALRARKEKEVQDQLLQTLYDRYDIVLHASAFGGADETTDANAP